MNNSKWQIFKVGLVNFWYYDEEEFYFLDGRMVLRGANGSGKSVTMQSFIPLLLDGNMRPERLDPFGSRARKMENYLLEEDDGREERTGYLYMEFKRTDAEQFLTIGIGMRARKNKKLEPWYFCITDGRRIGGEFPLYKEGKGKVPFSKAELKNRIGDGGRVMDTQNEYIACVNRLLFGFETLEEYREMLELLIQLRTPKLSKDFKPSVINDILSNSLQTLSEDDLRPMSEAIENMDSMKTNLDTLNDSIHAGEQMEKIYEQYNKIVLYEKAKGFLGAEKEYRSSEETKEKLLESWQEAKEKKEEERLRYDSLKREQEVLETEKASLSKSDAARLKEEEQRLVQELKQYEEQLSEKNIQEEKKREDRIRWEQKRKEQEEKNTAEWEKTEEILGEMEACLLDIPFDEGEFFRKEFREKKEEECNFSSHEKLFHDYQERVERGIKILEKEDGLHKQYDVLLQELDASKEKREQAEREYKQYENLLHETGNEFIEAVYQWSKKNQALKLGDETLTEMTRLVEAYRYGSDYSEITGLVRKEKNTREDELRSQKHEILFELKPIEEKLQKVQEEYRAWEQKKEPEPERTKEVIENRKHLDELNIEYLPFYQAVDFEETVTAEEMGRVEEALAQMGILDALIISEDDRETVLSFDEGMCDRYLFSDVHQVKKNISGLLTIASKEPDLLLFQRVNTALSGIGLYDGEKRDDMTWIDRKGNYRLGVLEGNVSKTRPARYIGAAARERYKEEKLRELREQEEELAKEKSLWEDKLRALEEEKNCLEQEWGFFPKEDDLKVAAREFYFKDQELSEMIRVIRKQEEALEKKRKELEQVRLEVQEICTKTYLTIRLDIFQKAGEDLRAYEKELSKIKISHERYLNGRSLLRTYEENLEKTDEDLDHIRYDIGKISGRKKRQEAELASVRGQLELTDYHAIKERLDYCIVRLKELPGEIEAAIRGRSDWEHAENRLLAEQEENKQEIIRTRERKEQMELVFLQEYRLHYVLQASEEENATFDSILCAEKLLSFLSESTGGKKQEELHDKLQEVFHQYKGYLAEYQLMLEVKFEDLKEKYEELPVRITRLDIKAKYRGAGVPFQELLQKLREDAEELKRLLSDKDRELFEDILANTISKKIRGRIHASKRWVETMNQLMESMNTSSGLKLSLKWKSKRAQKEDELDTNALVELLQKDMEIMRPEEVEKMSLHFRSKIAEARKLSEDSGGAQSFHMIMKEILDYRKWFEFQLECQKTGEKKKELTDRVFFTFSGGEKAMAMYVPLFSAVVAKYSGARKDAPRLISLDEAFAGVDETNIKDMFRLMVEFEFNFMINSQILWGDYETVPSVAIYQLVRPENARFVTVIPYKWNGISREMVRKAEDVIGTE
jgi:uncharacterized protein (TIGR02680 family)